MRLKLVTALLFVLLPYLATAFYAYIPESHRGAKKNVHIGNQVSKGFDNGIIRVPLRKRAIPVRSPPYFSLLSCTHVRQAKRSILSRGDREGSFPASQESTRAHSHFGKRSSLEKRVNDYQIYPSADTTVPNSAPIDQDGTDFSYFSEVTLGSDPGKTVYLLLDTGSSSAWVMGSDCTSTACGSHETFGKADSSTLEIGSDSFEISYTTGKVSGSIGSDMVKIGDIQVPMSFGIADVTSDDFDNFPMDGILGLGRSNAGYGFEKPTFMEEVEDEELLTANIFGINLGRALDNANDGEITFGAVDDSKYEGDLNYLDTLDKGGKWQIPMDDVLIDGKSASLKGRSAILDTGTTFMFLPPDDAKAMLDLIPGSSFDGEYWHIPCETTISVTLVFNNVGYQISPKDYVGESVDDGKCACNVVSRAPTDDETTWLLGGTFLKNVYTVYDMDKDRIGKPFHPSKYESS